MSTTKYTTESFIDRSIFIHGNKYEYTKTVYGKNNKIKIIITCKVHGDFYQTPDAHLSGSGCKKCAGVKLKTIHGLRFHPLYKRWDSMMQRCFNSKSTNYHNYGGRGITVSEEFKNCKTYIEYISSLPNFNIDLEVDRINNNGNYERGNLKWSSRQEQMCNTRLRTNNTTGYKGVSYIKTINKYRAYIYKNNKQIYLGLYDTLQEANEARKTKSNSNK